MTRVSLDARIFFEATGDLSCKKIFSALMGETPVHESESGSWGPQETRDFEVDVRDS